MTVVQMMEKIRNKIREEDLAGVADKLAIQVNLTGKVGGVFYIEVLHGVLSIMPYEYIDRDAEVSVTITNLDKVVSGKLGIQSAIAENKMVVEGNVDKVLLLDTLIQQR